MIEKIQTLLNGIKTYINSRMANLEKRIDEISPVQSDWAQSDESQPDYVKNRTHCTSFKTILPMQTIDTTDAGYGAIYEFASEIELTEGSIYHVNFGGDIYTEKAVNFTGIVVLGNQSILNPSSDDTGEPFAILTAGCITATEMQTFVSITSENIQELDSKYLQDDIPRYGTIGEEIRVDWDGNTDGLDTFVWNAFNYYKVSDMVIPAAHIVKSKQKRSDKDTIEEDEVPSVGENCYNLYRCIVVLQAGTCSLPVNKTTTLTFTAPSAGVYFMRHAYTTGDSWQEYVIFDTRRDRAKLYLQNPSGVTYALTVDDTGALSATEVTE